MQGTSPGTGAGYKTKYWCWVRDQVLVAGDLKELEGGRTSTSALSLEGGCISFVYLELKRRSERAIV